MKYCDNEMTQFDDGDEDNELKKFTRNWSILTMETRTRIACILTRMMRSRKWSIWTSFEMMHFDKEMDHYGKGDDDREKEQLIEETRTRHCAFLRDMERLDARDARDEENEMLEHFDKTGKEADLEPFDAEMEYSEELHTSEEGGI